MKLFIDYVKKHRDIWIWTFIMTIFCQGFILLSGNVGIDTSESLMTKGSNHYYVCLNMGRQGLVFLKWLTDTLLINPYVVGVLSLFFLWLSAIIWSYLFCYISGKDFNKAILFSNFVYLSSVLFIECSYYKVQCTEFYINFCLVGISLLWTFIAINSKKKRYYLGALVLMLVYMGTYQAITLIYVAGAEMIFFLHFYFNKSRYSIKEMWSFICKLVLCFLFGFCLNQLITKIFFSQGNVYYNDLMHWGNDSVLNCIKEIIKYIGRILVGNSIYYPIFFTILMFLTSALLVLNIYRNNKTGKLLFVLVMLMIILASSYLSIALGGNVVYRTQLVYPFVTMFFTYIAVVLILNGELKKSLKVISIIVYALIVLICYINLSNDLRLSYTDYMRNKEDSFIAQDLINRIENYQNEDSSIPVFFHGAYERELNPSCIYGESIGRSMFAQDTDVEPKGYYSTIRCIAYISLFGKTYNIVNDTEKMEELNAAASTLEKYPKENSVKYENGVILVNLGE